MWKTRSTWAEGENKRRQESVGSVDINPKDPENTNIEEARRRAQGTQGLSKDCTHKYNLEGVFSLSRLIRGFRNKYN